MQSFFAQRTSWNLATNRYTEALEAHRRDGRELLDITASNPTTIGFHYREEELLRSLASSKRCATNLSRRDYSRHARQSLLIMRSTGRGFHPNI